MNILLINHYAGSLKHGMEFRPFYLAREWVTLGHNVTIAAASFSHLRTHAPQTAGSATEEWIEGVRYLWFQTPGYGQNGAKRAFNMFAFVSQLLRFKKLLAESCRNGLAIASSTYPLDMLPASVIAKAAGARLVFEVHDLWPLTPVEVGGMSPRHPFIMLLQQAENFAYRHADAVVSLLPAAEAHMRSHGLPPKRFISIPNGVCLADWESPGECALPVQHSQALSRLRSEGRCIVGYAGFHGLANSLDTLLQAAAKVRNSALNFVLVGDGPLKCSLVAEAQRIDLQNVTFLPPVPKTTIPALLRELDVLTLCFARLPLYRFGVSPNKLIDYMMAGKPVVLAMNAANDPVAEAGCGISVGAEDPAALAEALDRAAELSAEERAALGQRGKAYVLGNHDYSRLAQRFLNEVELVGGPPPVDTLCDPELFARKS